MGGAGTKNVLQTGGVSSFSAPSISPAYLGVGYVIGPRLAGLQFSGGVLAWGFMVPLLIYFMGPQLRTFLPTDANAESWSAMAAAVWRYIVRPIAVGSMLVGAGLHSIQDAQQPGAGFEETLCGYAADRRTESGAEPDRAVHEPEGGVRADWRGFCR